MPLPALGPGALTGHHEREVEALLHGLAVHLVRQRGKAHVLLVDVLDRGGAGQGHARVPRAAPGPAPTEFRPGGQQGRVPWGRGISVAAAGEGLWAKAPRGGRRVGMEGGGASKGFTETESVPERGNRHIQ